MKKAKYYLFVFVLLIFCGVFFFSCTTTNTQVKEGEQETDPLKIFLDSLITANNSSYYIYKNKANIFILEKALNINFLYAFLKNYSKPINQYVNLNKFSRKKIEDESLKILLYKTLDKPFNNKDPVLSYIFDKDSVRLNDNNITFSIQNWGGVFDAPQLIIINMKNCKNDEVDKIYYTSVLFHEYLHYLFELRFNENLLKNYFSSDVEQNNIMYYRSFLTEMFSYYNHVCLAYFLATEDSLKLTEEKSMMAIRKLTQNIILKRSLKDPVLLVKGYYSGDGGIIYYLLNFVEFLIKYRDFDTFIKFSQYIFSGESDNFDEIFKMFYDANLEQIFELWKMS